MTDEPPFKIGQRVRMTPNGRAKHPNIKSHRGVVRTLRRFRSDRSYSVSYSGWEVRVLCDGNKTSRDFYHYDDELPLWEPVPDVDLSLDEVATALAKAVLAGDRAAALALADRVIELCR